MAPLEQVRPYLKKLRDAGTDMVARVYPQMDHGLNFGDREKPAIIKWILNPD